VRFDFHYQRITPKVTTEQGFKPSPHQKEQPMPMSEEHKAALAQGRRESRAIKAYLEALGSRRPGRPVTADSVRKRIESIDEKLATEDDPLKQLDLRQERLDAEAALKEVEAKEDIDELEKSFVETAKSYSERKGISYAAWRQVGVPASVLKEAGVPRTRKS
jgi:chromosome segregation ATPase